MRAWPHKQMNPVTRVTPILAATLPFPSPGRSICKVYFCNLKFSPWRLGPEWGSFPTAGESSFFHSLVNIWEPRLCNMGRMLLCSGKPLSVWAGWGPELPSPGPGGQHRRKLPCAEHWSWFSQSSGRLACIMLCFIRELIRPEFLTPCSSCSLTLKSSLFGH